MNEQQQKRGGLPNRGVVVGVRRRRPHCGGCRRNHEGRVRCGGWGKGVANEEEN